MSAPPSRDPSASPSPSKKRKRDDKTFTELEVNVAAPEPPSKKALRKAKRSKSVSKPAAAPESPAPVSIDPTDTPNTENPPEQNNLADTTPASKPTAKSPSPTPQTSASKRSPHGIWIGNLAFAVSKSSLRDFFTSTSAIEADEITRIHLPAPSSQDARSNPRVKVQNRGFAYVDFRTAMAQSAALEMSESLLGGRKVLIKDAKNFEGRPKKEKRTAEGGSGENGVGVGRGERDGRPPNERVFIGNLSFETTNEELREHFQQCGEVATVFVATFEDSGKCKGYGWVTFEELEDAEKAVRGYIELREEDEDEKENEAREQEGIVAEGDGGEETENQDKVEAVKRKSKREKKGKRRWWVNKLKGRMLTLQFAEDANTRYHKRFGQGRKDRNPAGFVVDYAAKGPQPERGDAAIEAIYASSSQNHKDDTAAEVVNVNEVRKDTNAAQGAVSAKDSSKSKDGNDNGPPSERNEKQHLKAKKPPKQAPSRHKPFSRDARNIQPGAAHRAAPRQTAGIVKSQGTKITFE